jgi:hypothetical protein
LPKIISLMLDSCVTRAPSGITAMASAFEVAA